MVQLVEAHGLQPVGVDPPSPQRMLPQSLKPLVTPKTKVLVLSHLFGTVHRCENLLREAKELDLLVVEESTDCAQSFLGAMEPSRRSLAAPWPMGFRGHGADVSLFSFGYIKTLSALGGGVAWVQNASLRQRMQQLQQGWPVRSRAQRLWTVLRAFVFKAFLTPCLYGFLESLVTTLGFDFDRVIVAWTRGFTKLEYIRQRPSVPLLETLLWRLQSQHKAAFEDSSLQSSVARRRGLAKQMLAAGLGAEVVSLGDGANSWWLLPILCDNPRQVAQELLMRGFDATSTSTQLQRVQSLASSATRSAALRASDGEDFMNRVVYLPLDPDLAPSAARQLAEAVKDALQSSDAPARGRPASGRRVLVTLLGGALVAWPSLISWLPSLWLIWSLLLLALLLLFLAAKVAQCLAGDPDLRMDPKLLQAMSALPKVEGVAFCRERPLKLRLEGAVLLTGATGFVGGGILFNLLARAEELGITRLVLLVRQRRGQTLEDRIRQLRDGEMFRELRETFDKVVVGLEGDVSLRNFGWTEDKTWPQKEPLTAVLHCAGDVRFQQPMQKAAVSLISATLQMQQLASKWKAKRFLFVSTAFVHAQPSSEALEEKLVELRDFDPMELYRDAMSHGSWAKTAMHELGFPNTYTFAKAIAEHLVIRACDAEALDVKIVRPSIVGPAWAFPYTGWAGEKPSTIVGAGALLARRGVRVFRDGFDHPCPVVPVDLVAELAVKGLAGGGDSRILHACLDAADADKMPSFRFFTKRFYQLLAIKGFMSLPELGFNMKLLRWCCESATVFYHVHALLNVLPMQILDFVRIFLEKALAIFGQSLSRRFSSTVRILASCSTLPMQYHPFSSPSTCWRFRSSLRLPEGWGLYEYLFICCTAGYAFAENPLKGPGRHQAKRFTEIRVFSHESALSDAFSAFVHPQVSLFYAFAAFVVRLALGWQRLTVSVQGASLAVLTDLEAPLVLCPQHRSILDFVLIGLVCFQFQPLLPIQLPQVAADAEFSNLPLLGWALGGLGAFFVRRGGGAVQPDPALRAKVGRFLQSGRPLEVFLEGLRSRGRRQLRLRTGLLKALRDISQRTVQLVPLALSYELLPEDESLYKEMCGQPRDPLSTLGLLWWVLRGLRGELPALGEAHLSFGSAQKLEASSDLDTLVSEVQRQLVDLTSVTTLHCQALAETLELPLPKVLEAMEASQLPVRPSRLAVPPSPLPEAARWALALQAATLPPLRRRLPRAWGRWLVEGLSEEEPGGAPPASLAELCGAFCAQLQTAEAAARLCSEALRRSGVQEVTEEHLLQELLSQDTAVPPPLARGAACVVAAKGFGAFGGVAKGKPRQPSAVTLLWPAQEAELKDEECLDRWGFKDTKFVAQYVDGRPAAQITSQRYKALGRQPLFQLWELFQRQLCVPLNVRDVLPERPLFELPQVPTALREALEAALPAERLRLDSFARIRAGAGHGLADVWRLRSREPGRFFDAVVRPESEAEVEALLQAAARGDGFGVIPVGGRTNVTSATKCPPFEVDPRPMVALDMRGLSRVLWVNAEDGVAMIEAGITGVELKKALELFSVTMGMEPDSMELSTLGGWIATRASGMKRARYGNIEDMVLEVRLATPGGTIWQRHGDPAQAETSIGRASTNLALPGLVLGSEGCLGVVTAAVVRVRPLPQVVEYQSVLFPDWDRGATWMREVARLPACLRPASCRLMDQNQLQLAQALKQGSAQNSALANFRASLRDAFLSWKGVSLSEAAAVTLVFEGSRPEVKLQKQEVARLVSNFGGLWGGSASGAAGSCTCTWPSVPWASSQSSRSRPLRIWSTPPDVRC
ncbi:unnamed protein product [Effrenium voratum]|nr:unnamed protein product [Effrenium voratum]